MTETTITPTAMEHDSSSLTRVAPSVAEGDRGAFPTHTIASRIAAAARSMGYKVRRSAASPMWRSAYVFCDSIKVRVADHPNHEMPDIDVHVPGTERPGSASCEKAIEWLRGRL